MAVTIYDLAREAGVSISTVSKALSGSYTISEKTRRHVLETARRLQYKPNARARSFARQKSGTVIFATELYQSIAFENPHMFAILTGVTRSLEEKGYSVLLKHMDKGGATAYVRELMQERLADGVILHAALLSRDLAAFLSHADAPYLVIGRPNFPCNICWMDVNHELAGGVAANYLLDRGYRRILYLGGGPEDAISQMRLKGMEAVLREEELTVDTLFGDTPYTEDVEELRRRLSGENRPEVALCANNHIALECLQCAMQLGLRIPRDLALMTFDRYPFSQLLHPPPHRRGGGHVRHGLGGRALSGAENQKARLAGADLLHHAQAVGRTVHITGPVPRKPPGPRPFGAGCRQPRPAMKRAPPRRPASRAGRGRSPARAGLRAGLPSHRSPPFLRRQRLSPCPGLPAPPCGMPWARGQTARETAG